MPVEPEVNRNFADGVGPDLGVRGVDRVGRLRRQEIGEQGGRPLAVRLAVTTISMSLRHGRFDGARERLAVAAKTRPGVSISMIDLSLPKSVDISE